MRPLPPPTLANLYPPVREYTYFDAPASLVFDAHAAVAAPAQAWWLAEHALLAYERGPRVRALLVPQALQVELLHDRASGSHAHAAITAGAGILAFRGTEALKPGDSWRKLGAVARDWWTDARVRRVVSPHGGRVHQGFEQAITALWPQITPLLPLAPRWWLCGHSLGGALALLAAARLSDSGARLAGVITYGQPRVGDAVLATHLESLPLLRVVNACDLVPEMPPEALGYHHAGALRRLDAERAERYRNRVHDYLTQLPRTLRHGVGAMTPVELVDHAPLYYAVKCFNVAAGDAASR